VTHQPPPHHEYQRVITAFRQEEYTVTEVESGWEFVKQDKGPIVYPFLPLVSEYYVKIMCRQLGADFLAITARL